MTSSRRANHCAAPAPLACNPVATTNHPRVERHVRIGTPTQRRLALRSPWTELLRSLGRTHFADGVWWRTQSLSTYAGASDVAWMIDASIDAYEVTGEDTWLLDAALSATYLLEHFWDGAVPRRVTSRGRGSLLSE